MNKNTYSALRILWFILAIISMCLNKADAATMFLAGAIYCRIMEITL